jgi:ankyrin repeat protein
MLVKRIFLYHTLGGGTWGDLVAAAVSSIREGNDINNEDVTTRVWIDLFAVRQWKGNILDICFPEVVKQVKCVLVIVSTSELIRVSELRYKSIIGNGTDLLNASERRSIPFMRTWCLAEINSAVEFNIPLIIACGKNKIDTNCTDMYKRFIFETNTPLMYNMQFLVFVENSEAQFKEDSIRILNEVINGVGIDRVNDTVKGAIISSMYSSKCHCIRLAVLGFMNLLNNQIKHWNVNNKDKDLFDSLIACCIGGYIDLFNYIIDKTCTFDNILNNFLLIKDEDGITLLIHSVRSGKIKMVDLLISYGSNVNEVSNDTWSPLLYAVEFGNIELIISLINAGANVFFESRASLTALSFSCQTGNLKCCEYLLSTCNCDIDSREGVGYTNLFLATKFNKIKLMNYLIIKGADCNARDNCGKPIISWAFDSKRLDVLQELLYCCDIDINIAIFTKEKVMTVLDLAIENGDNDFINLLKYYNASTLLELHLKHGHIQVNDKDINRLVKSKGLDINESGLIYMTIPIGYNTLIERNYPKLGEIVNMNEIRKPSNLWTNGIVSKGPDWNIEEDEDSVKNNEYKYGYIVKLLAQDLKLIVYWPLAKIKCVEHRVGYDDKYDLVYTY